MALPFAPTEGNWQREVDGVVLALDVASPDQAVPSGWCLRRLLMHICDKAVRTDSLVLEMGTDVTALAAEMDLPATEPVLQELITQLERLTAAKLRFSWNQEQALVVFDARSQRRGPGAEWRPRIRLSSRFHASLLKHAVPLDREIITALRAEALALDAHGWIRQVLRSQPAGQTTTVPWPELLHRFGSPEQQPQAFRTAFEDALRMVFAADASISLAADAEGVTVGAISSAAEAAEEEVPQQEAPVSPPPAASRHVPVAAPPPQAVRQPPPDHEGSGLAPRPSGHAAPASPGEGSQQAIALRSHLTGLPGVVWLRRKCGDEPLVIGVTPGSRFEPDRMTLLLLEPLVMQISGGLYQKEFSKVSAWVAANSDLIDLVWEGEIKTLEEASARVRKAPASVW